uniref:NADH-ubiquinone oxidoreductase chain 4 n=1 Tax=Phyxioschema suthepium TaxID=1155482 RepID=L7NVW9_9ARAC|nr:NADH dehydrogenase subunit 4 [Phyxioschema suthepium]AFC77864.1 NADH dehydrogenase subunit 4 [Phyxioschema suthepium]
MILPLLPFCFFFPFLSIISLFLSLLLMLSIFISFFNLSCTSLITLSDPLSFAMISLSIFSVILIFISSFNMKQIYFFISLILFLLLITFLSSNTILFFISFETVLIPTLLIITMKGKSPERIQAGIYLILYTMFGSFPLLLSIIFYSNLSSFPYIFVNPSFPSFTIFFSLAFLIKFPMFLFHLWLPKAHVEAPLEGSMILAATLLKLGGYGLIRFIPFIFKPHPILSPTIISISLMGALLTSLNCIRQKDIKALIAYSSVAHMALSIAAIFSFKSYGMNSAILMMFAHGLTSSALFFLVTIIYNHSHSRNILIFKGLLIISPNITFWFFILLMLNLSAPPSINIISEILIMKSLYDFNFLSIIPFSLSSLATASFSIFLYSNISNHTNLVYPASSPPSHKSFLSLFLHSSPSILLSLKPEIFFL